MFEAFPSWFPNEVAASLFIVTFLLWVAAELFNRYGFRHDQVFTSTQRSDHGSYWIIFFIVWASLIISLMFRSLQLGVFHHNVQYIGLGVETAGIVLREWAVVSLGRFFTVVVSIAPGQTLVQRGPYRWLRHPAYTGSMLTFVGFALALGSWMAALVVLVLCLVGFLYRIKVEETVLLEVFGQAYEAYRQRTWRLFLGL